MAKKLDTSKVKRKKKPVHRPKVVMDATRKSLIDEIKKIYKAEGFVWLLRENPLVKYSTEQLQIHVENLRKGKRSWKINQN